MNRLKRVLNVGVVDRVVRNVNVLKARGMLNNDWDGVRD